MLPYEYSFTNTAKRIARIVEEALIVLKAGDVHSAKHLFEDGCVIAEANDFYPHEDKNLLQLSNELLAIIALSELEGRDPTEFGKTYAWALAIQCD